MKRLIFSFLIILMSQIACKKKIIEPLVFTNNWEEDVYFFGKNLEEKHKDLFHNITKTEFQADILKLRKETENLAGTEIITELLKILTKVGDSHTTIDLGTIPTFKNRLPYRLAYLKDGIFITRIAKKQSANLMAKVIAINETSMETIISLMKTVITHENQSQFNHYFPRFLTYQALLNTLGIVGNGEGITFHLENGTSIMINNQDTELSDVYNEKPLPLYLKNTNEYYWSTFLETDNLYYIQYNVCANEQNVSFKDFAINSLRQIKEKGMEVKVAIDLRLNGGGASIIAIPLIDGLQEAVEKGELKTENIYVIIGRSTFSSAIINAFELKEAINPIFIGEPTGGKPNHYGELKSFHLPNSGIRIWYSTKYFKFIEEDTDSFYPDVLIERTSEYIIKGIDPVLTYLKER